MTATLRSLLATVLVGVIIAMHMLLKINLMSGVIAPLVLALWLSCLSETPEWWLLVLVASSELFSRTPPGMMTLAIVLPLGIRAVFRKIPVAFSLRFLALTLTTSVGQLLLLTSANAYSLRIFTFPWPVVLLTAAVTGVVAFLVSATWHELVIRHETVR